MAVTNAPLRPPCPLSSNGSIVGFRSGRKLLIAESVNPFSSIVFARSATPPGLRVPLTVRTGRNNPGIKMTKDIATPNRTSRRRLLEGERMPLSILRSLCEAGRHSEVLHRHRFSSNLNQFGRGLRLTVAKTHTAYRESSKPLTRHTPIRWNPLNEFRRCDGFHQIDRLLDDCEISARQSDGRAFGRTNFNDFVCATKAFIGRTGPVLHFTGARTLVGYRHRRCSRLATAANRRRVLDGRGRVLPIA